MVNNSTNINKSNFYLLPQTNEHKNYLIKYELQNCQIQNLLFPLIYT